jgi:glyoxylase-like metal-dependent hydrolase (beta-lactamase superfamily II)
MMNKVILWTCGVTCAAALAQAPVPAPAIETGSFPATWLVAGPNCLEVPDWQIHEYNANFYILRESGCTNYEKPFLYLIFGRDKALLVDTGAGQTVDTAITVQKLIAKWQKRNLHAEPIQLVVAHSHGHGDHVSGDKGFEGMANVTLVAATPEAEQKAFGIAKWPEDLGSIDLGDRIIDVLAIPGHQPAHLAYYDRKTAILLTGDHLYPGRLYVSDFPAYIASTRRLVEFTATRPVAHILGCHIEQSTTPFVDYPVGTVYQPHEHPLELGRANLLELMAGLEEMKDQPKKLALRDITIAPQPPRPQRKQ